MSGRCLLVVDGHALAYRSFFAIRGMRSPAGLPTGAIFGFVKGLERLFEKVKGAGLKAVGPVGDGLAFILQSSDLMIVVVWDGGLAAERVSAWPDYKAQRPEMPAELGAQIERVQEFLAAAGVASVVLPGVEADDLIAGLAEWAAAGGAAAVIASPDKDFMQLVTGERQNAEGTMQDGISGSLTGPGDCGSPREINAGGGEGAGVGAISRGEAFSSPPSTLSFGGRIGLLNPGDKSDRVWGAAEVRAKSGVWPWQVVDWLALVGDAVDNIPGVPGVGPKTAAALLGRFESVEGVYERLGEVESVRLRAALAEAETAVRRNLGLVRLQRVLPPGVSWEGLRWGEPDWGRLAGLFREWGFRGLTAAAEGRCGVQSAKSDSRGSQSAVRKGKVESGGQGWLGLE